MPAQHRAITPAHRTPSDRRLLIALALSVIAHLGAAAVLASRPRDGAHLDALSLPEPPPPETDPRITLGNPESRATSITWIGAEEHQPHAAPEGDVDQAAFTTEPTPPSAPPSTPPLAELQTLSPPAPPLPREETLPETPPQARPAEVLTPLLAAPMGPEAPEAPDPALTEPTPPAPLPVPNTALPEPVPPSPLETPEPSPRPAPDAAPSDPTSGEPSERQSDFSSTIRARVAQLGRPVAAEGIEILTVRPQFSTYTRLTAAPRDPLIRAVFDRNGKVRKVELLRTSGVRDVDRPILDAVYQWKARGPQLEALPEGDPPATLAVEISILL